MTDELDLGQEPSEPLASVIELCDQHGDGAVEEAIKQYRAMCGVAPGRPPNSDPPSIYAHWRSRTWASRTECAKDFRRTKLRDLRGARSPDFKRAYEADALKLKRWLADHPHAEQVFSFALASLIDKK